MPKLLIAAVIAATLLGCSKDKDNNKLPGSLQAMIDSNKNCMCYPFINEYRWHEKKVYLFGYSGSTCNWTPAYFDKDGNQITMPAGYDISQFFTEAKLIKTAWRCIPPQEY